MTSQRVTLTEIAHVLAGSGNEPLSKQAISQFVADGMPKTQRGQYDLLECVGWYLNRLRSAVKRNEREGVDGRTTNLEDERKRLISAQADLAEMDAQKQRGEVLPLALYEAEMLKIVLTVRGQMLSMPMRLAPRLAHIPSVEAKAILNDGVRAVLSKLAKNGESPNVSADTATKALPTSAVVGAKRSKG